MSKIELNGQALSPGDTVWVVERDEAGDPADCSGYMYVAEAAGHVIVSPFPDHGGIDSIMADAARETAEGFGTSFSVFPQEDCYVDKSEAQNQIEE